MSQKIWTPGYEYKEVSAKAEEYRKKYPSLREIPIDIDSFLQFDLAIDVVPYAGLKDRVQAEAMLSLDFSTIYVDNDSYKSEKQWNRLKFSLAHELGHFALH